jgi:hypothetical protein
LNTLFKNGNIFRRVLASNVDLDLNLAAFKCFQIDGLLFGGNKMNGVWCHDNQSCREFVAKKPKLRGSAKKLIPNEVTNLKSSRFRVRGFARLAHADENGVDAAEHCVAGTLVIFPLSEEC